MGDEKCFECYIYYKIFITLRTVVNVIKLFLRKSKFPMHKEIKEINLHKNGLYTIFEQNYTQNCFLLYKLLIFVVSAKG